MGTPRLIRSTLAVALTAMLCVGCHDDRTGETGSTSTGGIPPRSHILQASNIPIVMLQDGNGQFVTNGPLISVGGQNGAGDTITAMVGTWNGTTFTQDTTSKYTWEIKSIQTPSGVKPNPSAQPNGMFDTLTMVTAANTFTTKVQSITAEATFTIVAQLDNATGTDPKNHPAPATLVIIPHS